MDGQNFENENNVTVDTTATEVSSAAETVQETPVTEQPVNNYQDYTANVQPQAAATAPVQQPENKETNVLAIVSLVLGILDVYKRQRPNVTADAFGLCFKTGNAVILKGGSDAIHSNIAIVKVLQDALEACSMPRTAVQLIEDTDRAVTAQRCV